MSVLAITGSILAHRQACTPILRFTDEPLVDLVTRLAVDGTLLVADSYNTPLLAARGIRPIEIDDSKAETIAAIGAADDIALVVAVGGCTALDVGRAIAAEQGVSVISVPTILSNSCISSPTSVIEVDGRLISHKTTGPRETVISMPTIIANHADPLKNWSASGLGDLLSTCGAAAEQAWLAGHLNAAQFSLPAQCRSALDWVEAVPYPLDEQGLGELAQRLHDFSIDGHEKVPAASEHQLYYTLRARFSHQRMVATHGKIVGFASLLALLAWVETTGDDTPFNLLRACYQRIGVPISFAELGQIGIPEADFRLGVSLTCTRLMNHVKDPAWPGWEQLV